MGMDWSYFVADSAEQALTVLQGGSGLLEAAVIVGEDGAEVVDLLADEAGVDSGFDESRMLGGFDEMALASVDPGLTRVLAECRAGLEQQCQRWEDEGLLVTGPQESREVLEKLSALAADAHTSGRELFVLLHA